LFHILFDNFNYLGSSGESNKDVPIIVTTGSKTSIADNYPSRSNSADTCLTTPAISGGIETPETDDADDREIKVVGKKVNWLKLSRLSGNPRNNPSRERIIGIGQLYACNGKIYHISGCRR